MNNEDRWKQRFQNFQKSFEVLQRRIDDYKKEPDEDVYQLALIHAFDISIEISHKTIRDYLENVGLEINSPKDAIRHAFQVQLVSDAEAWMEALETRDLTSDVYDDEVLHETLDFIQQRFYPVFRDLNYHLEKEL